MTTYLTRGERGGGLVGRRDIARPRIDHVTWKKLLREQHEAQRGQDAWRQLTARLRAWSWGRWARRRRRWLLSRL